jgi:hypothetical protein
LDKSADAVSVALSPGQRTLSEEVTIKLCASKKVWATANAVRRSSFFIK